MSINIDKILQEADDTYPSLIIFNLVFGLAGMMFGYFTNKLSNSLSGTFTNNIVVQAILHLLICAVIIALIHLNIGYRWEFHDIIPGIFFITLFFHMQKYDFD